MSNTPYSQSDLETWDNLSQQAARKGGEILLDWSTRFTSKEKSPSNLVTEADFASQDAIHKHILAACPEHGFIGEEGLNNPVPDGFNWVIDPLDGTGNYVHTFPYFCVSIGLAYKQDVISSVIYDPNRDEMFTARKGGGAFLNNTPISVSRFTQLKEAFVVGSIPLAKHAGNPAVKRFAKMLEHAQTVQRTGSAALNLAYVAAGRMDAFWSSSLYPWDMTAGSLLVEEAGGKVSSLDLSPYNWQNSEILASNNQGFHEEVSQILCAIS